MGLGWVGKICKKNILHELRLIKSNFRSIEPCRFSPINLAITRFQLLQINTLWASLNLDSTFWSWFANIIHNEVLIHLVPKVLEPNKLPLWQSMTKHITKMKCSKLQTAHSNLKCLDTIQPNYYLLVARVDNSYEWINLYIPETLNKHINACVENKSKTNKFLISQNIK